MPLVLIMVPKTEKYIFHLKQMASVVITVESQKSKTSISQCFRCLRFGHAQSRCTVKPRCVKCAGEHHRTECNKNKGTPPKCANCGGSRTASYRGCSSWPQRRKKTPSKPVLGGVTYAKTTKTNAQPAPNNMSLTELTLRLGHTDSNKRQNCTIGRPQRKKKNRNWGYNSTNCNSIPIPFRDLAIGTYRSVLNLFSHKLKNSSTRPINCFFERIVNRNIIYIVKCPSVPTGRPVQPRIQRWILTH